ncbi:DUF1615 domain-containing protein [Arenimonas composti]|uniref:DUF1615 domain-containing protein n=1 Tax=Arenimonas composti TR7-09 = DSM 18010 TaxID=1121013 RepID=A0A091B9R8_9GAMM|nr:DUF1615 domain-containing protein [Arenimonas composti]KFN48247.1 hypothetical protein P873_01435 [Arenimonas composti TR7-09 = DSM 18010]
MRRALTLLLILFTAACTTAPPVHGPSAEQVRAEITRRIPARVPDREGWAADIQRAFAAQGIPPTLENQCAVLAVIEQEGGYVADPVVPGLATIARRELDRRAGEKHIPRFAVDAALRLRDRDGRAWSERLAAVRTERELSEMFEDMAARLWIGEGFFAGFNPVHTGGPMQVSIDFAERNARGYPYPLEDTTIRREVFTRRGGLYFGIAHLLGYQTPYTRKVHRFADYNAGWYASRNAAFQRAVAIASGRELALDGDLLRPGAPLRRPGETEAALRTLSAQLGMDDAAIRRELQRGNRLDFGDSALVAKVYALAEARHGAPLPRAQLPGIRLESPKITRELTTAWFAERVNARYQECLSRK